MLPARSLLEQTLIGFVQQTNELNKLCWGGNVVGPDVHLISRGLADLICAANLVVAGKYIDQCEPLFHRAATMVQSHSPHGAIDKDKKLGLGAFRSTSGAIA